MGGLKAETADKTALERADVYLIENYDYNIHSNEIDILEILADYEREEYSEKQTRTICKIIRKCMEHYSKDTTTLVGSLLNSHERVFQIEKILETNPTEQELLTILRENGIV